MSTLAGLRSSLFARTKILLACGIIFAVFAPVARAQNPPATLTTTFMDNAGSAGSFFDVSAKRGFGAAIAHFDVHLIAGTWDIEIWSRPGSYVGATGSSAGWSMIASYPGVVGAGTGTPTALPDIPAYSFIANGATNGYAILATSGTPFRETTGGVEQTILASDAYLDVLVGQGSTGGFSGGVPARSWNGVIHYEGICTGTCLIPETFVPTVQGIPGSRTGVSMLVADLDDCAWDSLDSSCGTDGLDRVIGFFAPFEGTMMVEACGAAPGADVILAVLDGPCGNPELACSSADTCGMGGETVVAPILPGQPYTIVVDSIAGGGGLVDLVITFTEIPTTFVPCTIAPNTADAAQPLALAVEQLTLPASGGGGGSVAYIPCHQQYYAFSPGVFGGYEVFDDTGLPLAPPVILGLDGRSLWLDPGSGELQLITFNALGSSQPDEGYFNLGLDVNALFTGTTTRALPFISVAGPDAAGAVDYQRNLLYSRENSATVRVTDMATGFRIDTITLDFVGAGSPAFVASGIGFTGIFGFELVVPTDDSAVLFDRTGAYAATVPLGMAMMPGDLAGSYAGDLFWTWDGIAGLWRGFELFDASLGAPCSTAAGGNLTLLSGAHTIDTDTGSVDAFVSPGFDGTAFNFDTITLALGSMVTVTGSQPLVLLATGNASLLGTIDLDGSPGMPGVGCNNIGGVGGAAGPGGGDGGDGSPDAALTRLSGLDGGGFGGGQGGQLDTAGGGGGGFDGAGGNGTVSSTFGSGGRGGFPYSLLPPTIAGGSGGGGGSADDDGPTGVVTTGDDGSGGGGGGGGALLVNAMGTLTMSGTISARGGDGGATGCSNNAGNGGGGSGGYIALLGGALPSVTGTIDISGGAGGAVGSVAHGGAGAPGRTLIDLSPCAPGCDVTLPLPVRGLEIPIDISLFSMLAPTVDLLIEYSLDGGATFLTCTAALASPLPNPATGVAPGMATFLWNAATDGVTLSSTGVIVQVSVDDMLSPMPGVCASAPFDLECACGDCNTDGFSPAILDSLVAAQIAAGIVSPSPAQLNCCDTNASASVTITDSLQIAQAAAGIPVTLTCP